jgi:hypothetical protein
VKDRREYEQAVEIIGDVIRAWDPFSLMADGAPADEFDDQIAKITARVPTFRRSSDAAEAVSAVFSEAFGSETFSPADCAKPGEQIFTGLGRAHLLSAA